MKRNYQLFALTLVISLLLFLCACSSGGIVAFAETPELTSTVVPSPTSTPTPSPEPTPTLSPSEQKEAEINQEIQGFLNAEGIYQDYKMWLGALTPQDKRSSEAAHLGVIDCRLNIQGCLIDYIEKGDYYLLIFGFENKDEERFVTTLGIPKYFYEGRESHFRFFQSTFVDGFDPVVEDYSHEVMLDYLNRLKGKVCGFPLIYKNISEKGFQDRGQNFDWVPRYVEEANNSTIFAKRLLNTVTTNDIENWRLPIDPEFLGIWRESRNSEPIVGLDKIDYDSLSGLDVPFIRFLISCKRIG